MVTYQGVTESRLELGSLIDILRMRAESQPDRNVYTFLQDSPGPAATLSYGELDRRARSLAAWLQSENMAGERVLLLFPPGLDYIVAFFGCLYAKAVCVPAYPPIQRRNLGRLQAIIGDARPALVLTTEDVRAKVAGRAEDASDRKTLRWKTIDSVECDWAGQWRHPDIDADTLAFLQYTSGSTSNPKGVMINHGNLLHNERIIKQAFGQTERSVIIGWLPLFHDMGLIGNVLQPLYIGSRCILLSPVSFLQRPFRWLDTISRYRGTTSGGPNFAYDLCVRKIAAEQAESLDLSSWEVAFNGSEPVRKETIDRFCAAFEPYGFRRDAFYPCYGLAEATLFVAGGSRGNGPRVKAFGRAPLEQNVAAGISGEETEARELVSCGGGWEDQQIAIVNPESLIECEPNRVGEIWVSGASVAHGYWGKVEESSAVFGGHLPQTGQGPYLRTGDLGFIDGGHLYVTGRLKDLIIIRGRNYYPEDIEQTVGGCDAALVPGGGAVFSADIAGEERLLVVHEVERRLGGDRLAAIAENIRRAVSEEHELQAYAVTLIKPGALLRTSSGKVRRRAMRDAFQLGDLEALFQWRLDSRSNQYEMTVEAAGQRSLEETTEWLVTVVAAMQGLDPSEIDPDQPMVRYGLDSLSAMEFSHRIEMNTGAALPITALLAGLSISKVAATVLSGFHGEPATSRYEDPSSDLVTSGEAVADFPLSYGQKALWFLNRLAPKNAAYNVAGAARIRGELNVPALMGAFQALIKRHPLLRVRFDSRDGELIQIVQNSVDVWFRHVDLSGLDRLELNLRITEESRRPFDLKNGPLFRFGLFGLDRQNQVLVLSAHHIVIDLWSLAVLLNELSATYSAELRGTPAALPAMTTRYEEYVRQQERTIQGRRGEELRDFWGQRMSGELPVLNLPADYARPVVQTYEGESVWVSLDPETTANLQLLARDSNTTLYTVLLAAYLVWLHRLTGQEDLIVGCPATGRTENRFESVVGYFVNTLAVRVAPNGLLLFRQFLDQVRETALAALEHQDYPFALLVEELRAGRDPSRSPVFQTTFVFQRSPVFSDQSLSAFALGDGEGRIRLGSLALESVRIDQRTSQFDLSMVAAEAGEGISLSLQYNRGLFKRATVERLLGHFQALIDGIGGNPQQLISEVSILKEFERRQILEVFNDTKQAYAFDDCLHHLFERQVERTPAAVALVHESGCLTYQALNERANRLARHLRRLKVAPETCIAVLLERSPRIIVALLAVLKAGGAYLPLDSAYPAARLSFMIEDTGASLLICGQEYSGEVSGHAACAVRLDEEQDAIEKLSSENLPVGPSPANLAYIIYTSGSTGRPKGVAISHQSVVNFLLWAHQTFSPEELAGVFASTSVCFDLSIFEIFAPLSIGGAVILGGDALDLAGHPEAPWVRLINTVPSAMTELLGLAALSESVHTVNLAGEALKNSLAQKVYSESKVVRLLNLYGPTEYTTYTTLQCVERGAQHQPTIGRPIANTRVFILDAHMGAVPIGVFGEVFIGGSGLARCYVGRPDVTAERFIPDCLSGRHGKRLYRTGDLGRFTDSGEIEYSGRKDHQAKIRGYRIELGELESVLLTHPDVKTAVVDVQEDDRGDKELLAYIVTEDGKSVGAGELRDFLRKTLPGYMTPQSFVMMESIPLTPNGKVDRHALPRPETALNRSRRDILKPGTPIEELVVSVWTEVLGPAPIGVTDNFFELGGHSLKAVQVVSRLSSLLAVELPVKALFEAQTVRELARVVERAMLSEPCVDQPPIERVSRDGPLPLSFAQQRLWFLHRLGDNRTAYNIAFSVRFNARLNLFALEQSINEIVRRHEALRTAFPQDEGSPEQVIAPRLLLGLPVADLSGVPERQSIAEWLLAQEARKSFDLESGPLLRLTVIRLEHDRCVLCMTVHHIAFDGWSAGIFIQELGAHYEEFCTGASSQAAPLAIQYADFTVWQRARFMGERGEAQMAYWKNHLSGSPAALDLPGDRPRPAIRSHRGASVAFTLPQSLITSLEALGRREGSTLFMTLLAAFQGLLSRYSGQDDVSVGTPVANRGRPELEPLIGCLVNTLVMRVNLAGDPLFTELLRRVREIALGAYAHQDLPFERLVSELAVERDLSRTPLFQVAMALQSAALEDSTLGGLHLQLQETDNGSSKFDMTVQMARTCAGVAGRWEYSTDLFDKATVERIASHYGILLEAIVENSERRISDLTLLTSQELRQLLVQWNDTAVERDLQDCLHLLIERRVQSAPDTVAVVCEAHTLSYKELDGRANQLSRYLLEEGAGPESCVGVMMDRSIEMMVALLATLKVGAAYVPVDPRYPDERISFLLEDSAIELLLVQDHLRHRVTGTRLKTIAVDAHWSRIAEFGAGSLSTPMTEDNPAYMIYTSGSTGRPKGAMISHRAIVNRLLWMQEVYRLDSADRVMQKTPFSFDVSVWEFFWPLMTGASLVFARPGGHQDAAYLARLIGEEQITTLHFVPSMLAVFLEEEDVGNSCGSLRRVICSGEALSFELQERFFARLGAELHNLYGPTEAAVDVTWWQCVENSARQIVPIGRPISNIQTYVLDARMRPVPVGVAGELHIGGVGLARGYFRRPGLTSEKFVANPFTDCPGMRLYKTGDLVRFLPDSEIEYLGRIDHQVKIRGFRVEMGEIEVALMQHPGVQEATLQVADDPEIGKRLVAYVVPSQPRAGVVRKLLRLERQGHFAERSYFELPNGLAIVHQNNAETEFLYREIFSENSYLKHGVVLEPGDCVFDVGANIGMFSLFVKRSFPNASIYAFEPLPPLFEALKMNMSLYAEDAQVFECGLSDDASTDTVTFYPHLTIVSGRYADSAEERDVVKSFLLSDGSVARSNAGIIDELLNARLEGKNFECEMRTLSDVIAERNVDRIDLLKIDVEKSEMDVLAGIRPGDWPKIRQLVVEVHDLDGRLDQVKSLLHKHGYVVAVEQGSSLSSAGLYNVFARREASNRQSPNGHGPAERVDRGDPEWFTPEQLIADLRKHLKERLPEYMSPSMFVLLEELPLTLNGKIDRKSLPKPGGETPARAYEAPRTPAEKAMASIWEQVLKVDRVSGGDNFFDRGGDSILSIQAVAAARRAGLRVTPQQFFQYQTLAELALAAEEIAGKQAEQAAVRSRNGNLLNIQAMEYQSIDPVSDTAGARRTGGPDAAMKMAEVEDIYPLTPLQHGMLFHVLDAPGGGLYVKQQRFTLKGDLDIAALKDAFQSVMDRHQVLRSAFIFSSKGDPLQAVYPGLKLPWEEHDFRHFSAAEKSARLQALLDADEEKRMDLSAPPLMRMALVRLETAVYELIWSFHLLLLDGWSVPAALKEVLAFYDGLRRNYRVELEPPFRYGDYVDWLQRQNKDDAEAYWRRTLAGFCAPTALGADRSVTTDSERPVFKEKVLELTKSQTLTLRTFAVERKVTLNTVVQGAWALLLSRRSGVDDVVFGGVVSGRSSGVPGIDSAVGNFINNLPVRVQVPAESRVAEWLEALQQQQVEARNFEFCSLVDIQGWSDVPRGQTLFECMLVFQNIPMDAGLSELDGLRLIDAKSIERTNYPLSLVVEPGSELLLKIVYDARRFRDSTIDRILETLHRLLIQMGTNPEARLSSLSTRTEVERNRLVQSFSDSLANI